MVETARKKWKRFLHIIGPGLITGAADDDPAGIATYVQAGAMFGLGQLWTVLVTFPLMTAVQETCARIGAITGKGLASVIKKRYGQRVALVLVLLVLLANIINIGADIGAMAAALQLLVPVPFSITAIFFTVLILIILIVTSYKTAAQLLKWLALTLIAYPLTALIVGLPWRDVAIATLVPGIEWNSTYLFLLIGVLGTTISPYLFFWEASEEVEEELAKGRLAHPGAKPIITQHFLQTLRLDNLFGMSASQVTMWFIIIVGAVVLHANGITDVNTAADAAKAIEPLVANFPNAGFISKTIFASGIIGLGLLAVPVLAGASAYALSDIFGWKEGLNKKFHTAKEFYFIIIIAIGIGLLLNFTGINPIKALIFSSVFNGIAAVPLLFFIAKLGSDKKIMGKYRNGVIMTALVWIAFSLMGLAALGLLFSFLF